MGEDRLFFPEALGRISGTNYNYFRHYDPQVGRYVGSDPYGLAGSGSGWNKPFVPDSPLGYPLGKCCDAHEDCYGDCENRPAKSTCDSGFHSCMLNTCNSYNGVAKWACEKTANTYYDAVTTFGGPYFDAARKNCPSCGAKK